MFETRKINDNVELTYIPMQKMKTTTICMYIHRPLSAGEATNNALLATVLRSATKKYPTREELSIRLDELFGTTMAAGVQKIGDNHILFFDAECISQKYSQDDELMKNVVELLCQMVFEPKTENDAFCADVFDTEKKNLIEKIRSTINDKRIYASERLREITCEGEAYAVSRIGTETEAEKITKESLYQHYLKVISESKIDFYIAGDSNIDRDEKIIKACVEKIEFKPVKICKTKIIAPRKDVKVVTEKMDVTQGKLAMSFTTEVGINDADGVALNVANSIFGGGAHSKLFNNVREKMSLCYYVSSGIYAGKGFMAVNAGVEVENFQKAHDEILNQLHILQSGEVSDEEMTASKKALISTLNTYYDDQLAMISYYYSKKILGDPRTIEQSISDIESVTTADVVRVSQKLQQSCEYYITKF